MRESSGEKGDGKGEYEAWERERKAAASFLLVTLVGLSWAGFIGSCKRGL